MRTFAVAAISGVLLLAGLQPAAAASKPAQVGMVSFVAASYSRGSGTAGLTIDWPNASRATSYEVFLSRSYSMSNAKRYKTRSSTKRFTGLRRGVDYFVQVRGVRGSKVGTRSNRVGHTTIRRMDPASGPTYRVMTYNVCSKVCGGWESRKREPAVIERIRAYRPDVLAAQEAGDLLPSSLSGYAEAVDKSAKRLLYKTSRLQKVPYAGDPGPKPEPYENPETLKKCDVTYSSGTSGYVFLGHHGDRVIKMGKDGKPLRHPSGYQMADLDKDTRGCRYAVWAVLKDRATGDQTIFVDVHTVAGDNKWRANERTAEMRALTTYLATINKVANIPIVYAGDFNSHKNRSNDEMRSMFHRYGYYDAYDLAMALRQQHYNSYNDFSVVPKISYKWGDHVDHVWIRPDQGRILRWSNGAKIVGNRMVPPIPSDHSPIIVDVRLN